MKGETRLKILDAVSNSARLASDLFFIFTLPYGSSFGHIQYMLRQKHKRGEAQTEERESRQRFYDLLYRLRKDGLVREVKGAGTPSLKLTERGREYLKKLHIRRAHAMPIAMYAPKSDDVLKIVIFDIPERERKKRGWLRSALRNLEFTMLQRSVWVGKVKLPERFLQDLQNLHITSYVEIFAINRSGSLKRLPI